MKKNKRERAKDFFVDRYAQIKERKRISWVWYVIVTIVLSLVLSHIVPAKF